MSISRFMVGSSEAFERFAHDLERVAKSDATVLIQGESGSGKSIAARALHGLSERADGPLVSVELAALSPSLLEAELFGHADGAFTGARGERLGRFRAADGGTLILDGIESLPREFQVKLLRALQERTIEPLGSDETVPIDVRVVATSVRDLLGEVEAGEFREDLYYRLAVVTLQMPNLRSRMGDLEPLVGHLTQLLAERIGVPARAASRAAFERLAAHPWPGNVRELENALERVMVLAPDGPGSEIQAEEFAFLDEAVDGAARRLAREALSAGLDIERVSLAMMDEAMEEQHGNVSAAARQVGLSRRAFEYRRSRRSNAEPEGSA